MTAAARKSFGRGNENRHVLECGALVPYKIMLSGVWRAKSLLVNVAVCVAVAKHGSNTEEIVREIFVAEDERAKRDVGAGKGDESRCYGHDELAIGDLEMRSSCVRGKTRSGV